MGVDVAPALACEGRCASGGCVGSINMDSKPPGVANGALGAGGHVGGGGGACTGGKAHAAGGASSTGGGGGGGGGGDGCGGGTAQPYFRRNAPGAVTSTAVLSIRLATMSAPASRPHPACSDGESMSIGKKRSAASGGSCSCAAAPAHLLARCVSSDATLLRALCCTVRVREPLRSTKRKRISATHLKVSSRCGFQPAAATAASVASSTGNSCSLSCGGSVSRSSEPADTPSADGVGRQAAPAEACGSDSGVTEAVGCCTHEAAPNAAASPASAGDTPAPASAAAAFWRLSARRRRFVTTRSRRPRAKTLRFFSSASERVDPSAPRLRCMLHLQRARVSAQLCWTANGALQTHQLNRARRTSSVSYESTQSVSGASRWFTLRSTRW